MKARLLRVPYLCLAIASVGLLTVGCGKDDDKDEKSGVKIKTELLRTAGTTYRLADAGQLALANMQDANRYAWTSEIDIKSLKLPIRSIVLSELTGDSGTQNPQTIYECATDCDVDLLGPELTDLLGSDPVEINATGNFQQISVSFGEGATDWTGKITAEFMLGGQKYYTKADGPATTTGPAEEAAYIGMGGGSVSYLPEALVMEPSTDDGGDEDNAATEPAAEMLTIKLYFDALYAAYAVDGSKVQPTAVDASFCAGGDVDAQVVRTCVHRLVVSASTQATPPTKEQYLLNDSSLASLYFDNGTSPLGGSLRGVYREGYPYLGNAGGYDRTTPGPTDDDGKGWASAPVFGFKANADGTYFVSTTIGEPSDDQENGGFRAEAFERKSHSGKFKTSKGNEYDYTAVKL